MSTGQKRRPTSNGCLPCRWRKKRCDLRRPTCLGCERNVLLCSWATISTRGVESTCLSDDKFSPIRYAEARSPRVHRQPSVVATRVLESPLSSLLYQHWLERTGNTMSAQRGTLNSFITVLPRLALNYPDTVLQSLLALSGVHYANLTPNREVDVETWTHLGLALRYLKHGLTVHATRQSSVDPLPLLTTTLVLCFVETTRGDRAENLVYHLDAARYLLRELLSSPHLPLIEEDIIEFLKEFYVYVESITGLTGSRTEYIASGKSSTQAGDVCSLSLSSSKSPGCLLGCSHELFNMISEVHVLTQRHRSQKTGGTSLTDTMIEANLYDEYQSIHTRVSMWLPPPTATLDFAASGYMYQEAILSYLETTFIPSEYSRELVTNRLHQFVSLLLTLIPDSPISATLTWPLVVFGVLATEQEHRDIIYERLAYLWQTLGLKNIELSMAFLSRLWMDTPTGLTGQNRIPPCAVEADLGSVMRRMRVDITFV